MTLNPEWIAAASAFFAFLAAFASFRQATIAKHSTLVQEENCKLRALLDVRDQWSNCLAHRYKIKQHSETYSNIKEKYDSLPEFMASPEWSERLRPICNFYEYVGLLAHHEVLKLETMLVFVTIDPQDREIASEAIAWLRDEYRTNIYKYWDWLLEVSMNAEAKDPFMIHNKTNL